MAANKFHILIPPMLLLFKTVHSQASPNVINIYFSYANPFCARTVSWFCFVMGAERKSVAGLPDDYLFRLCGCWTLECCHSSPVRLKRRYRKESTPPQRAAQSQWVKIWCSTTKGKGIEEKIFRDNFSISTLLEDLRRPINDKNKFNYSTALSFEKCLAVRSRWCELAACVDYGRDRTALTF